MLHPNKWRDTIDPFVLPYKTFTPLEILGYPHAGNDVFHARGLFAGREVRAYIKVARQRGADIDREVAVLSQLDFPHIPRVIDFSSRETPFSVTLELPGQRLSAIVGDNRDFASMAYLREYGRTLALLHRLTPDAPDTADRRFFHQPEGKLLERLGLTFLGGFFAQPPVETVRYFCHGDFHYANVLWEGGHISGILDFELCGYGNRDFDIAWALFCRPGQKFLRTRQEREAFLAGYAEAGEYDPRAVGYYMAQIGVYFLSFCGEDETYCGYIREQLKWL